MKNTILAILILITLDGLAQGQAPAKAQKPSITDTVPNSSIILRDNAIVFEKGFETTLSVSEVMEKLKSRLSKIKEFELGADTSQNKNLIIGKLIKYRMDYRNYGGSLWATPSLVMYPMSADIQILLKDGSYLVTASDMKFKLLAGTGTANNLFIKPNKKLWKKGEADNGALCITVALTKMFDINQTNEVVQK